MLHVVSSTNKVVRGWCWWAGLGLGHIDYSTDTVRISTTFIWATVNQYLSAFTIWMSIMCEKREKIIFIKWFKYKKTLLASILMILNESSKTQKPVFCATQQSLSWGWWWCQCHTQSLQSETYSQWWCWGRTTTKSWVWVKLPRRRRSGKPTEDLLSSIIQTRIKTKVCDHHESSNNMTSWQVLKKYLKTYQKLTRFSVIKVRQYLSSASI